MREVPSLIATRFAIFGCSPWEASPFLKGNGEERWMVRQEVGLGEEGGELWLECNI